MATRSDILRRFLSTYLYSMLRERRESQLTNISEAGQGTNGAVCREREKQQRGRTTHKWCSRQRERERAIARVETACNMYSHRGARMARPSRALLVNSLVPSRPLRWPRSATSDIRHLSSVIRHLSSVISFLVGAVMGVACLLASAHVF